MAEKFPYVEIYLGDWNTLMGLVEKPQVCHCEESKGRRSNLEVVALHTSRLLHPRKRGIRNDRRAVFSALPNVLDQ
jgi:hypothetical protein